MRLVYDGFRVPLRSVIWIWSFADERLRLFEDGVTLTRTEGLRDSDLPSFPPSKYSINKDVWLLLSPLSPKPLSRFLVEIVMGLPSEGNEYVDFCVSLLPVSSSVSLPVLLSVSVGAGRGGPFRESGPILATSNVNQSVVGTHAGHVVVVCTDIEEAGGWGWSFWCSRYQDQNTASAAQLKPPVPVLHNNKAAIADRLG